MPWPAGVGARNCRKDMPVDIFAHSEERIVVSTSEPGRGVIHTSYGELCRHVEHFTCLIEEQWSRETIIPFYFQKSAPAVALMLAALRAGKAFACINPKFRLRQIQQVLSSTGSGICVTDGGMALSLERMIKAKTGIETVGWQYVETGPIGEPQESAVGRLLERGALERPIANRDVAGGGSVGLNFPAADLEGLGCVLFTSGSTGQAKGVKVSRRDLLARAEAEVDWFGLSPEDILLGVLPLSFDVGLNQLLSGLVSGARIVFSESWLPGDICNLVESEGVTGISGVPSIWQGLIESELSIEIPGKHASLRYLTVSGGSLPRSHLERLQAAVPEVGIFKTYGQTEAFRATSLRPEELAERPESVGRAFSGVEIEIVGPGGAPCGPGEVGEVVHSGLGIMEGYLEGDDREKRKPNPFYPADSEFPIAVFTGDHGYLDAEGFLYLHGRKDDMVKVMGNRVYPLEVEEAMRAMDAVAACAVTRHPGEGPDGLVAFVVEVPESALSPATLQRDLSFQIPGYMIPREIHVVPALPLTASGKTDFPLLLASHAELRLVDEEAL